MALVSLSAEQNVSKYLRPFIFLSDWNLFSPNMHIENSPVKSGGGAMHPFYR